MKSTANSRALSLLTLVCVSCASTVLHARPGNAPPLSISSSQTVQLASGAQIQQQPQLVAAAPGQPAETSQQKQLSQRALGNSTSLSPAPIGGAPTLQQQQSLQAHLNGFQAQAQRQISQLNGLMLSGVNSLANSPLAAHAANLTNSGNKIVNVLEVLSNVGRAIHQQIVNGANSGNNQIQIITSPNLAGSNSANNELSAGNSKKNEYQSIVVNEGQQMSFDKQAPINSNGGEGANASNATQNYREQSEQLRQEIVRRAGQLQQVVASSMEVLKNNGDLIVRRLLEQLNGRLDQAKAKADKIINEPAMNEVAIKALTTINQGLNNLNNIIMNIVNRLDINGKDVNANLAAAANGAASISAGKGGDVAMQRGSNGPTLDPNRFKLNFHQIGQQFSSAINAVQQQQRQMQLQQRQQRSVNLLGVNSNLEQ